jgi:MFS family permease
MSLSGLIFFATTNFLVLVISAFIGTINITGTETGAFLSIEQAALPQTLNNIKKRNTVYALYNMAGTFAMSAGVLLSGLPEVFVNEYDLNQIESTKPLFLIYSIIGLAVWGIYCLISPKVEIQVKK